MRTTPQWSILASALVVLGYALALPTALAHGGGLDSAGCHHDRKLGGYHCHRAGYIRPAVPANPSPAPQLVLPRSPAMEAAPRHTDVLVPAVPAPNDWQERDLQQRAERAKYWKDRGLDFDPRFMSTYAMDQKAGDVERAQFWSQKGYSFNPQFMSAYAMDQKVRDIERARFWTDRGHSFNPEYMSAYAMDQKVKDIERAKYWAERGFEFNPQHMSAYTMDREVEKSRARNVP